jgi:glutathione peroxidase
MSIYNLSVKKVNNELKSLSDYKGLVFLIFNSATKCGFTPQYEGIEKLYETYKDQGFEVLDFPCNQFMNQAPGSNDELKSFCELKYHTKFETFAKVDVNGKSADPLFKYLRSEIKKDFSEDDKKSLISKLVKSDRITWNFTKFLVDRNGKVVYRFGPSFEPSNIEKYIKELL